MANKNTGQKPTAAEEPKEIKIEEKAEAVLAGALEMAKAETRTAETAESPSGIWSYIGPNLRGLIHTGKTFRGRRAEVMAQAERVLAAYPEAKRLIVAGEVLTRDRERVKTPGNVLYETYQAMERKEKEAKNA